MKCVLCVTTLRIGFLWCNGQRHLGERKKQLSYFSKWTKDSLCKTVKKMLLLMHGWDVIETNVISIYPYYD